MNYSPSSEEHWFFFPSLLTYPSCLESLQPVSPSLPWGPVAVLFFYWEKILSPPVVTSAHLPEVRKRKEGGSFTQWSSVTISHALGGSGAAVWPFQPSMVLPLLMLISMPCVLTACIYLKVPLCVYLNSDAFFKIKSSYEIVVCLPVKENKAHW